jgi:hypothetical protein
MNPHLLKIKRFMQKPIHVLTFMLLVFLSFTFSSCKRGCTDVNALNNDVLAVVNDGTCEYSKALFYANAGFFNGIPILKIDVSINGSFVGTISNVYPNGPGNCSAPGAVQYQFLNGKRVDWNTVVYLANGGTIGGTGTASPSSVSQCIYVNVTR